MKPTYTKEGETYQPAIKHDNGKKEIWGPPLGSKERALYYAQVAINERRENKRRKTA
jgi:hypothetical protein